MADIGVSRTNGDQIQYLFELLGGQFVSEFSFSNFSNVDPRCNVIIEN